MCSPSRIVISIVGTDKTVWVTAGELSGHAVTVDVASGQQKSCFRNPTDEELTRAQRWAKFLEESVQEGQLGVDQRNRIAKEMGVSTRTVLRHLDRYLFDQTPANQLPDKPGPARGSELFSPVKNALIEKAIEELYESEQRSSIRATTDRAGQLAAAAGISPPSYTAVRSRVRRRDRWRAERKRHGRVRGNALAGPAGNGIKVRESLALVQMDHAIVDVIVVDPESREEIGRPWITLAIDVATRCVVGFYLSFEAPSQTSVALALEHCCCPKDDWLREIGYEGEWLPFGLMKTIGWDNAKTFRATSLCTACKMAGIEPRFRQVRTPVHGCYIERYIGTYMGKVHLLKGTTFSNTKDREDYDSQKKAVMSLAELIKWTAHQINGVYHNTLHKGLGKTPLEAWNSAWTRSGQYELPPFPADRRAFLLSLLPGVYRPVTREGLHRFNLKYWDDALVPFIGDGKKYWVAHNPLDVSCVYFRLGDAYIDIPWRDRTRRPIALFELTMAKKALKREHNCASSEAEVFEHIKEMRRIEDVADSLTREQRRIKARRPRGGPAPLSKVSSDIDYTKASVASLNPMDSLR
ncbi:Mu transposase C-terminal domain-containing protein [Dyella subtropica]|uniref:Mu transposase C-terminal domain-containing protein n=1 Tax=Dyella subtropica TaxID=2992127 RepID=UPI0022502986|nr:Mu transposase C-terminal domain-containing protein [Dyella subtropica]